MWNYILTVLKDEEGAQLLEYVLLLMFIAIIVLAGVESLGLATLGKFQALADLWPGGVS